jgi:hypothetical protein
VINSVKKYLQAYWKEVIKIYKRKNLIFGISYTKKIIKIDLFNIKNFNQELLHYYNVFCILQQDDFAYLFYKFISSLDYLNLIEYLIDLFTIF